MNFLLVILVAMPFLVPNSEGFQLPGKAQVQAGGAAVRSFPGAQSGMQLMGDAVSSFTGSGSTQPAQNQQSQHSAPQN
uniref:Putative salivary secreted protein n=1 Tax=Ornithodoros parkeri TaxID=140564 RepID=A6N9Z7_ORNPR|nr:putative salivary secreted protein [Ornithodoros parkeri]